MTGIPETRSLKKWGVSNRSVVSSESNLLAPIDIRAPIPFQLELQQLYEHIELKLEHVSQKVIVITSATHGEGNSTIAAYYALLLYRRGNGHAPVLEHSHLPANINVNRVLLIDANFRRPAIHRLFNIRNDVGFAEILQHKVDMAKSIDTRQETKLTIVTAGSATNGVQDFLKQNSLSNYIRTFKQYYNYIVVDAAPVLPYWDALSVGRICDGVVLNIRAEQTKRDVVLRAKTKLEEARIPILGTVLNQRKYHIPKFIYDRI
ncbi:CpsD/CapB family tyrosine-protein kinase [candidate division KSB1 bacterium]|nr:CpsD/CapB family tyrosine-protein kinase [candidate division KSB1 bacterium]